MVRRISSREARTHFAERTDRVKYTGEPVIVEKQGEPFVAVVSLEALEELERLQHEKAVANFERLLERAHASTGQDASSEEEIVEAVKRTREETTKNVTVRRRLRVAIDASILIPGFQRPYWPSEVIRACSRGLCDVVLPEQVIAETLRHLPNPEHLEAFKAFLNVSSADVVPSPPEAEVAANLDLVRSAKDVPIALS